VEGKMLMDSRETEWYASMLQILGQGKGFTPHARPRQTRS
jgi:hypothetical protein